MSVALYVPLMLLAVAVLLMAGSHVLRQLRERKKAEAMALQPAPRVLIHSINDDRCTGCDACVAVCPTDVLELANNKSRVMRFGDCIQCEQCMFACPTQALVMHFDDEEPPPLKVPALDSYYQTAVPGMYLIGEVAGKPLVKNAANAGRAVVEHMMREGVRPGASKRKRAEGSDAKNVTVVDVAIVGSGPGGLSAALTCMHHGLSYVVLEKEQVVASTVARYPKGKDVMAEPYDVRNVSFLPIYDATKEQLVAEWQAMIKASGLAIRMGEAVEDVRADGDGHFNVRTTVAAYRAQRVILATGTRGKPRTLGVPGENQPKVQSLLDDPDLYRGRDVLVVGGGDSAVEAACALADAGARVSLSYRGKQFNRAQAKNRETVTRYAKAQKVTVLLGSNVIAISEHHVTLQLAEGRRHELQNQALFVLIGADPPVAWLEKLGVGFVERPHWYALGATDQLVESLVGHLPESARDVPHLVAAIRGQARPPSLAEVRPPVPEPSVMRPLPTKPLERPRTLPGRALDFTDEVFTSAQLPPDSKKPIPLEEFARRNKEQRQAQGQGQGQGQGQRKKARPAEVTRILRALRDEGARLAHDETGVSGVALGDGDLAMRGATATSSIELSNVSMLGANDPFTPPPSRRPGAPVAGPNEPTMFGAKLNIKTPPPEPIRQSPAAPTKIAPAPARPAAPPASARPAPAAPVRQAPSPSSPPPTARPAADAPAPRTSQAAPRAHANPATAPRPAGSKLVPPPPSRLPDPDTPAPTRVAFLDAKTAAASPDLLAEMARVRSQAGRPVRDDTEPTSLEDAPDEYEIVSRDPDDDDRPEQGGWEVVDATAHADAATIDRLRAELKRSK
jgi:thioredoxin reductase/NAD-dependent dihydropyrimidine dehydrogenase PreA subunit